MTTPAEQPNWMPNVMHTNYRNDSLAGLRDQLTRFTPRAKRLAQSIAAETLLRDLADDRNYAVDYVQYRITLYRSTTPTRNNIRTEDLRHDLRLLIEDLSESADITVADAGEPVYTPDQLAQMWEVSTKTVGRWRRDGGLVARKFIIDGRRRVGFLQTSVDHFQSNSPDKIRRGSTFTQLTEDDRVEVVQRARQFAAAGTSPAEVIRQLALQMQRSPETIRYTLNRFDADHASGSKEALAIFPHHRDRLNGEDKRLIDQLHSSGASIAQLSRRFKRDRATIHRVLVAARMQRINELPLDYIYNADFDVAANADVFTGPTPPAPAARKTRPPAELPGYLASLYEVPLLTAEQEVHLFRKLNFLKHTAATLREKLNDGGFAGEKAPVMDRIESLYEAAVQTKNLIVQSNLRLVVSIAKRHIKSSDDFFTLVSDGNMSLIKAVEKFDYARGNKFSTYATWSIVKNFARSIPNEYKHQDRFRTTTDELFVARQDNRIDPYLQETVQKQRQRELARILDSLDEREQKIITARFGLRRGDEPLTLKEVGAEIGVTKERVRQLEMQALAKLRAAAAEAHLDVELGAV